MSITELDSRIAVPSRFWVGPESWLVENLAWSRKLTEASCHPKAETWPWLARIPHLGSHRGWGCHGMPVLSEVPKWQRTDLTRHRTQLAGHKPWDALFGAVWRSSWRQISGLPKISPMPWNCRLSLLILLTLTELSFFPSLFFPIFDLLHHSTWQLWQVRLLWSHEILGISSHGF